MHPSHLAFSTAVSISGTARKEMVMRMDSTGDVSRFILFLTFEIPCLSMTFSMIFPEFFMNAVKCNLTELTKKSTFIPLYVLVDRSMAYGQEVLSGDFVVAAHHPGSSPPTPFPSLFPLFQQCHWCLFLLCMRAHGCFAWICQPWEQSSSRSWLPTVEAP